MLATALTSAADLGPDLRAYVSLGLPQAEQRLMRAYINELPLNVKAQLAGAPATAVSFAVVDGATGMIHYNQPADIGTLRWDPARALPGDAYPFGACMTANPGCYAGSGPYRRVYTLPVLPAPAASGFNGNAYWNGGVVTTTPKTTRRRAKRT